MWDKTLFILSKVDLLSPGEEPLRHCYYELGALFARSFLFLPVPIADTILTLALPQRAKTATSSQLPALVEKIKVRRNVPSTCRII